MNAARDDVLTAARDLAADAGLRARAAARESMSPLLYGRLARALDAFETQIRADQRERDAGELTRVFVRAVDGMFPAAPDAVDQDHGTDGAP